MQDGELGAQADLEVRWGWEGRWERGGEGGEGGGLEEWLRCGRDRMGVVGVGGGVRGERGCGFALVAVCWRGGHWVGIGVAEAMGVMTRDHFDCSRWCYGDFEFGEWKRRLVFVGETFGGERLEALRLVVGEVNEVNLFGGIF